MAERLLLFTILALSSACGPADMPPGEEDPGSPVTDEANAGADPVAGAAPPDARATPALWGDWTLIAIGGAPLPSGTEAPTMSVTGDAVTGFAGVNRFQGTLGGPGEKLFGPMITTRMAGPPAVMELEHRFLRGLDEATGARITADDELILESAGGAGMRFLRSDAAL